MRLHPISKFIMRHAGWIAGVGTLVGIVGLFFSVLLFKNLKTDIEELLPTDARSGKDLTELTHRLESFDNLAIVVLTQDKVGGRRFVDDLVKKLNGLPKDLVAYVEYKIDKEMQFFKERLALYLETPDLLRVKAYIHDRIHFEKEMYSPLNIFPVTDRLKKPELDFTALRHKYQPTGSYDSFPSGYYTTPDETKRIVLIYVSGKHSDVQKAHVLTDRVREMVAELNPKNYASDMEVKYTGDVQNLLEEHTALIADLKLSSVVVIILVSLALLLFYRDTRTTSALLASIFIGVFWSFGVSYFAVGYLNANSAFLGSIVIGNGVNFAIIFLARYLEERRKLTGAIRANDLAIRTTATSTLTAALGAGFSYGSLMLTRFRGFRQFGVIGFIGMVLCWISAYLLLPAYLTLLEKYWPRRFKRQEQRERAYITGAVAYAVEHWSKPIVFASAALTLLAFATLPRLKNEIIETDLSKLRNKESLEHGAGYNGRYIEEVFRRYLTPIVALAHSPDDALEISKRMKAKKAEQGPNSLIAKVQTLQDFVPPDQEKKIPILRQMKKELTPEVMSSLEGEEGQWVQDYLTDAALVPFTEKDLPELILKKLTERDGSRGKLVLIEPPLGDSPDKAVAWEGKVLIGFIQSLREVADSVRKGTPIAGQLPISADMVESISKEGPIATLSAFIAVIFLIVLLFRHVPTIALCLFALILGVIWLFGCILGFNLKINFLNFIALPITFGIGIDYGVNIFQRYRLEGPGKIITVIRETGGAVMLASLTTIIGYYSLVIAQNQAFVSFGTLAVLGEITCVTAAVVCLPAFLHYWERRKTIAAQPAPDLTTRREHYEINKRDSDRPSSSQST